MALNLNKNLKLYYYAQVLGTGVPLSETEDQRTSQDPPVSGEGY